MSSDINRDTIAGKATGKKGNVGSIILITVVIVFFAGIAGVFSLRSDMHRLDYIKRQLAKTYGVTFADGGSISKDDVFSITSSDGVDVTGTCNMMGKIRTESYINHYYGAESARRISDKIGACFDECVIVANNEYQHNWAYVVASGTINSYEEYLASLDVSDIPYVFVYVRETESSDNVKDALSILIADNEPLKVLICALPDDKYEAHRDFGQSVYTGGPYMDALNDPRGSEHHEEFLLETVFDHEGKVGLYSHGLSGTTCEYLENNEWIEL